MKLHFLKTILVGLIVTASIRAHAILVDATPSANAVIHDGHLHVLLHFNSRVDGKRSQLTLISMEGQTRIPLEAQTAPDKLAAADMPLKSGAYRLIWQVLAADGHLTRGQIPFKVQ